MRVSVRVLLVLVVLVGCVGCDQMSKATARACLPRAAVQSYFGDTVRLQLVENAGAFLSIGDSLPHPVRAAVFTVGVAFLVGGLLICAVISPGLGAPHRLAIAAMAAGGLGNVIDRLRFDGLVTDFLNVGLGPVRTGVFNVADATLMLGVLLLLVPLRRRPPKRALRARGE
jgi:signal peptidase II